MKTLKRITTWGVASIMGVVAIYFVAYTWEIQWDLSSGKQRMVHKFCGIAVWSAQPTKTILSDWLSDTTGGHKWKEMGAGPRHFAMVTYGYTRIIREVYRMGHDIEEPAGRDRIARLVLTELEHEHLNRVQEHCENFNRVLWDRYSIDTFDPDRKLDIETIDDLWAKSTPPNKPRLGRQPESSASDENQ